MEEKTKNKLKPAKRYVNKEKVEDVKEKHEDVASSVSSPPNEPEPVHDTEEQADNTDVVVPVRQTVSVPSASSQGIVLADELKNMMLGKVSVNDFCIVLETVLHILLDNRDEQKRKAEKEKLQKKIEAGGQVLTVEQVLGKCMGMMEAIVKDFNLYKDHKLTVNQQQDFIVKDIKQQESVIKQLGVIVGRIEKVQGVKVPKRPPFPSLACLTFLFWHWPMYAFSYCWLSKYFRRFCFLVAFFVMILQFCLIVLLAGDNRIMHYDRAKYITVRNWSLVDEDSSAMNRFNKVDRLYQDVDFNREEILELEKSIMSKHERLMEKRRKEIERGLRR